MHCTEKNATKRDPYIFTVDSFADGISFGQHRLEERGDARDYFSLHLTENEGFAPLRSRYALNTQNPFIELESHLSRISKQGILRSSTIYFGTLGDPFFPFEGKFDASMKFLALFQKYQPGLLVVQTRSPLLVLAMPVLQKLGRHVSITIGIETPDDAMVERYTPGLPRIDERLKLATTLRRFGIEVSLQVAPVLPYGEWKRDAGAFADLLCAHGDLLYVRPLCSNVSKEEKRVRALPLYNKLAEDRRFHYLRPDSANPLITEIERRAPHKVQIPQRNHMEDKQLSLFVA